MHGINLIALTPSLDERIALEHVAFGGAYDAVAAEVFPAGKAVNCAAALSALAATAGATTPMRLFGIVGAGERRLFDAFHAPPVISHWISDPAPTRQNLTLVDGAGALICHVRRPTLPISPRSFDALLSALDAHVPPGELAVVAGRMPKGLSAAHLGELTALLHRRGSRIVVDLRPESLAGLDLEGVLLAKPNLEELSELSGTALSSRNEILHHARRLAARGPEFVVVSMGAAGALLVARDAPGYWLAESLRAPAQVDPVGCGDAMVAGICLALARGEPPDHGLRAGMAAGYANLFTPGPGRLSVPHLQDALSRGQVTFVSEA